VVQSYPHDRQSFTQGLVYENGILYEGTGLYGQSALFQRDLPTGKVLKTLRLPDQYFGEGIALVGDRLFQLTWQSGIGFIYRKDTFTPLGRFRYRGEGWGLAYDGKRLILSDGTATLRFLDPNTCAEIGRLEVHDQGRPVAHLNELEFVAGASPVAQPPPAVESGESPPNTGQKAGGGSVETGGASSLQSTTSGLLYANIWPTDRIAIIDPATGRVTAWINLSGLYTPPPEDEGEAVPNGIAWLPQTRHLLVTGKLWPQTYEIELIPR
jgi:glutamine cyclotransferase